MARRVSFLNALDVARRAGPCDAVTLLRRLYDAGWRPKQRPEEALYGAAHSMNHRLDWRCRRGQLAKAFVAGRNVYFHRDEVQAAAEKFDLSDPVARKVAADWVAEQGDEQLAGLLRKAKRFTFGAGV